MVQQHSSSRLTAFRAVLAKCGLPMLISSAVLFVWLTGACPAANTAVSVWTARQQHGCFASAGFMNLPREDCAVSSFSARPLQSPLPKLGPALFRPVQGCQLRANELCNSRFGQVLCCPSNFFAKATRQAPVVDQSSCQRFATECRRTCAARCGTCSVLNWCSVRLYSASSFSASLRAEFSSIPSETSRRNAASAGPSTRLKDIEGEALVDLLEGGRTRQF